MKRAVFIELFSWHSECIYSQLLYLKTAGYYVELVCNKEQEYNMTEVYPLADKTIWVNVNSLEDIVRIREYVEQNHFDQVILGTIYNRKESKGFLNRRFVKKTDPVAGLHDLRYVNFKAALLRRAVPSYMKRFLVLADYVKNNFPASRGCCLSIPLIFQPDYPNVPIDKPADEIWIAVPGMVNLSRRDYMALLPQQELEYDPKIKFILLGTATSKEAQEFRKTICQRGLSDNFVFFDSYVNPAEFYSWARLCDYVMLLIHPGCKGFKRYIGSKISGSLNVSLMLRKPMLCDVAFSALPDFAQHSLFYKREDLAVFVNSLIRPDRHSFYNEQFERLHTLEALSQRYISFLEKR